MPPDHLNCLAYCLQVSIQTGDVRGAGTDSDISIQLFGSKAQSAEKNLESSADNFERNKVGTGGHYPGGQLMHDPGLQLQSA
jgi:hypothetical protein